MGIFVLGGPFVAGFWLRYLRIMNKAISAYKPLRTEVQKDDSFVKWIDKNIGHSKDIWTTAYSRSSPNEQFHMQTAILMAAFTKPHFNFLQLPYKLCIFTFPCVATSVMDTFFTSRGWLTVPLQGLPLYSLLIRGNQCFLFAQHATVKELYDDFLPVSHMLKQKRVHFGAHCYHIKGETIFYLIWWRPNYLSVSFTAWHLGKL